MINNKLNSFLLLVFFVLCTNFFSISQSKHVVISNENNQFSVFVNNQKFIIKGVGGQTNLSDLKNIGGNTIRTWSTDNAQNILDEAHKNGIMVMMGLWVQHERHGFDYNNEEAVKNQLEAFRLEIQKYKNHPALLFWCVGNEYEVECSNKNIWKVVNDIALMIKQEDDNHPIVTVTASINEEKLNFVKTQLPAIDILGINTYGDIGNIKKILNKGNYTKAYLISEWGPHGHWESQKTSWGASIEHTSKQKASLYLQRYKDYISADSNQCLGSFAFFWGQKQEYTSTWYGIFHENGQKTEVYDALAKAWSPDLVLNNYAPSLDSIKINKKLDLTNLMLKTNEKITFNCFATDKDKLSYQWELYQESTDLKSGGDEENKPTKILNHLKVNKKGECKLTCPKKEGKYRLFVSVSDGEKTAYCNVPFLVSTK
jgi:hypothetical protein